MGTPVTQNEAAKIHSRVRRQHKTEITQDYVETIYRLITEGKQTRVTDLQEEFGVSHVTVIRTLARLVDAGLVVKERGAVSLTDEGEQMAVKAYERHKLVEKFLLSLGVSEETACADAEGIEHHLSDETLAAMARMLDQ